MAVIMIIATAVVLLFQKMKLPAIIGYLVAGMIIGPNTPPFVLITNIDTVNILAELGIIFMMFVIGLEFDIKKFRKIGGKAVAIGTFEISIMIVGGYLIGLLLGWGHVNSLFLGAVLMVSSTAVIAKMLSDNDSLGTSHATTIIGVLIVEDIAAVIILTLLGSTVVSGVAELTTIVGQLLGIAFFLVVTIAVGTYVVPKVVDYITERFPEDVVIVSLLGLCFGMAVFARFASLSTAIGAFVMGVAVSESKYIHLIVEKMRPLAAMFLALFFLSMGMLISPEALVRYAWQIAIFACAFIVLKFVGVTAGAIMLGAKGKNAVRSGLGMLAIGEFSFVIAKVGTDMGVVDSSLYPITLGTALVTMVLFPLLFSRSDAIASGIQTYMPKNLLSAYYGYASWVRKLAVKYRSEGGFSKQMNIQFRRIIVSIVVILVVVTLVRLMLEAAPILSLFTGLNMWVITVAIWAGAILLLIPPIHNMNKKLTELARILSDATVETTPKLKGRAAGRIFNFVRIILISVTSTFLLIVLAPVFSSLSYIGVLYIIPFFVILIVVGRLAWSSIINAHDWLDMVLSRTLINEEKTKETNKSDLE